MQWLFICDLDEFLWSSYDIDLKNVLKLCSNCSQIQFDSNCFGSNGLEIQPKYVIPNFIKRGKLLENNGYRNFKYIINSDYNFEMLNVHHASYVNIENKNTFKRIDYSSNKDKPYFILNHYITQSKEFWLDIKCKRGDSDNYLVRTIEDFNKYNEEFNEEEDLRLYHQNINMNIYL